MREADERQRQDLGGLETAHRPHDVDEATQDPTRYSTQGPYPPVAGHESVMKPTASELAYEETPLGPGKDWPKLLLSFFSKFPAAARQISKQPSSLTFVKECEAKGAKFGGYAEEGPSPDAWPYTLEDTVFIPRAHTDPLEAMSDFLFELNNAIRFGKFLLLDLESRKGAKGRLDAKSYAREIVALEVEGMLKAGEVWLAAKKEAGKEHDHAWSAHDDEFYLQLYLDYKAGKLTKADIVERVLHTKYTEGDDAGKTTEEFYEAQFTSRNRPLPPANTGLIKP